MAVKCLKFGVKWLTSCYQGVDVMRSGQSGKVTLNWE